jgi:small subunit ribosomal protein S6
MTLPAPTYDLVLLLDSEAEEPARAKILTDAREAIAAQGELLRDDAWGERALTYPIAHKATAKYHLLQFHAGSTELLSGLDRTLRIADEVVRFRIVKLKPGTPAAPDMSAPGASAVHAPGASPAVEVAPTPPLAPESAAPLAPESAPPSAAGAEEPSAVGEPDA